MAAREQVEFHVVCMMVQAGWEATDHIGGKILVLRSRDVEEGRIDVMILGLLPILGNAPADADDTARLAGIRSYKAIVQTHWLREAHQDRALWRDGESGAQRRRNSPHDLMMQADV